MQPLPGVTHTQFSLIRFRSPLLTEYLFLRVLRCFTSPRSPLRPINSDAGNQKQLWPGFPIRTPSDQRSFANSPRHIAGYNVLLRLLVPRHPPNALNKTTKTIKILASTIQLTNTPPTHTNKPKTEPICAWSQLKENHTSDSPTTQQHATAQNP